MVAKLQGDISASQSSMELYYPWISGPLRFLTSESMGERQIIAQKGVRAIDARNPQLKNHSNAAKTSVRAPGLSTDEREHPFVRYFLGWLKVHCVIRKCRS